MRPGEVAPAHGNLECITLLERWLAEAKRGKINYVALAVAQKPQHMAHDYTGCIEMEPVMDVALAKLKEDMAAEKAMRSMPPVNPALGADCVSYNLSAWPVSFDTVVWMADAEMTRRREGAPAPLKVTFVQNVPFSTDYHKQMLHGVVKPALGLLGAVEGSAALHGRSRECWTLKNITEAARNGEQVPIMKARPEASHAVHKMLGHGPAPVTITLREADYWPHRNSDLASWLKFGEYLEACGERVIFLRDTCNYREPLGVTTYPLASVDLHVRMALYGQAKCNLFVANGPWTLALFSKQPWLMFNETSVGDEFVANTPDWWPVAHGIKVGEQFPWSAPDQRIIWQRDNYSNLVHAWEDYADNRLR